jgi:hypothetical protein
VLIENEETYTVYDGLSRVIKQGQGNREQMIVYDAAGNVTETFDPYEIANGTYRGRVMTYNSGGKVLTESDLDPNDRKSYTGAQVLRWVHEEKLTGVTCKNRSIEVKAVSSRREGY